MRAQCVAVAGMIAFSSAASAQIMNGGIESGTGADADNWNEIQVAGSGATALVERTTTNPFDGNWAFDLTVVGNAAFGPVAEIQQQTAVGSVVGGAAYNFSFWATGNPGPGTVAFYEVVWFDGDGSDTGGPQGSATGLQSFDLNPDYTQFSQLNLIAPTSADSVFIQIRIVTGAFDGASGSASIDNVSFALVPTPASASVLALAGLAATRRRR